MRTNPHLLELHAFAFLTRLSQKYAKKLSLLTIPEAEWRVFASQGFDLIWLMGVWRRSPGARAQALRQYREHRAYRDGLPDIQEQDIQGSAYAIYGYTLDPFLGKPEDLGKLRKRLNRLGLKLMLDFVPNHLAHDHPWTRTHPEYFVQGDKNAQHHHPGWFFKTSGGQILAHGRDPHFPPWDDTVQMHFFSPAARKAQIQAMQKIAAVCDGVRCDMAMLGLNAVFKKVWHEQLAHTPVPKKEFWEELIPAIKSKHPDFIFMAEVYWDLERELQILGFDYTYDKIFYDKVKQGSAQAVRDYLAAPLLYQNRCARFIENHDEPRAVTAFGKEKAMAAAALMATLPGLRFFHDGQMSGYKIHIPVQLSRGPKEAADPAIVTFYRQLIRFSRQPALHEGQWELLEAPSSAPNLLAWQWTKNKDRRTVLINFGPHFCEGMLPRKEKVLRFALAPWEVQLLA